MTMAGKAVAITEYLEIELETEHGYRAQNRARFIISNIGQIGQKGQIYILLTYLSDLTYLDQDASGFRANIKNRSDRSDRSE